MVENTTRVLDMKKAKEIVDGAWVKPQGTSSISRRALTDLRYLPEALSTSPLLSCVINGGWVTYSTLCALGGYLLESARSARAGAIPAILAASDNAVSVYWLFR